ncbi:unnamed protein product [Effrenium voratum]|nr:unnamed protein product [Effrenium voratum]
MAGPAMVSEPACVPCGEKCAKECAKDCSEGCKMECDAPSCDGGVEKPLPPEADAKKAEGNTAFQAKQFEEASRLYGEAIAIAEAAGAAVPGVYFSNRAVCLASLNDWEGTRSDAAQALQRLSDLTPAATKKALFQKARAESRLQLAEDWEATLALADKLGLRVEVERLLGSELRTEAAAAPAAAPVAAPVPAAAPVEKQPSVASEKTQAPGSANQEAAKAKEAGTARYKDGDYRGALQHYRAALDLVPKEDSGFKAQLLGNVAAACLMLKRATECADACTESLALDPSNSKVRARLATAQVARGDFQMARSTLGEVGEDPALANALKQIGTTEASLAEADEASKAEPAKALNMYLQLESTVLFDFPPLALKLARCYLELRQYPRVLNTTQQVLRSNPRSIEALLLRSQAQYRNHNAAADSKQWVEPLEQAQRLLKEALSFDPDHQEAQAFRKRLRSLCGKHGELKELMDSREFEKALEVVDSCALSFWTQRDKTRFSGT